MKTNNPPYSEQTQGVNLPFFLTQDQLAERLQRTPRSIYQMRRAGILPYVKLGASVLFDPVAVAKALEKLTVRGSNG